MIQPNDLVLSLVAGIGTGLLIVACLLRWEVLRQVRDLDGD